MTRLPYRVAPAASHDLDDQAAFLHQSSGIETAIRFLDAARTTFETLDRNPGIGEPRRSKNPRLSGLRVRTVEGFRNYLAFYMVMDQEIRIVRVLHGTRDLGRVLDEGFPDPPVGPG